MTCRKGESAASLLGEDTLLVLAADKLHSPSPLSSTHLNVLMSATASTTCRLVLTMPPPSLLPRPPPPLPPPGAAPAPAAAGGTGSSAPRCALCTCKGWEGVVDAQGMGSRGAVCEEGGSVVG